MFSRRNRRTLIDRVRDAFWPRLGWARYFAYLRLRLTRLAGTPHSIALGFACGVGLAPTPLMGAHLVGAALLAVLLRGNVVASALGSLVGNPWTYPAIWVGTFELGRLMVPDSLWTVSAGDVNFVRLFQDLTVATLDGDVALLVGKVLPAFMLMLIGSVPPGVVGAIAAYWGVRRAVERLKHARERRRQRRRERAAETRLSASRAPTAG